MPWIKGMIITSFKITWIIILGVIGTGSLGLLFSFWMDELDEDAFDCNERWKEDSNRRSGIGIWVDILKTSQLVTNYSI